MIKLQAANSEFDSLRSFLKILKEHKKIADFVAENKAKIYVGNIRPRYFLPVKFLD